MKKETEKRAGWTLKAFAGLALVAVLALIVLLFHYKWMSQNDRNDDGRPDEWIRFNFKGEKIEYRKDKNFDSQVDYIELYQEGFLRTIEVDFDYDGFFETKGTYDPESEILLLMERDTNQNGVTDRRTVYDETSGLPLRVEIDADEDGVFEKTLIDPKFVKQEEINEP